MHYHCEIIIPPTAPERVKALVTKTLEQFDENNEEARSTFWDFWTIGGRWAGEKATRSLDQEKLKTFQEWLQSEKVTVSGLVCGKEELSPPSQRAKVDAKWNEMFPSDTLQPCPLFRHSNNQYDSEDALPGDIMRLGDVPKALSCARVIIVGPENAEAVFMVAESVWNGVNHMDVKWDGTLADALRLHQKRLSHYRDEYRNKVTPQDDWLVVTVDYHS